MSPIPSRLYNAAVGGHVAGADQIIDDETGLTLDKVTGGALEEKTYTSGSDNGMGRVVLRKNLVEGINTLTQSMINKSNTIYVIQYDFTLGEDITVPANCILEFDGGSISASGSNDTITGANTGIKAGLIKIFGTDVTLAGSWNVVEAYPEWFGGGINSNNNAPAINKCLSFFRSCTLSSGNYDVAEPIYIGTNQCLRGNSKYTTTITKRSAFSEDNYFIKASGQYIYIGGIKLNATGFHTDYGIVFDNVDLSTFENIDIFQVRVCLYVLNESYFWGNHLSNMILNCNTNRVGSTYGYSGATYAIDFTCADGKGSGIQMDNIWGRDTDYAYKFKSIGGVCLNNCHADNIWSSAYYFEGVSGVLNNPKIENIQTDSKYPILLNMCKLTINTFEVYGMRYRGTSNCEYLSVMHNLSKVVLNNADLRNWIINEGDTGNRFNPRATNGGVVFFINCNLPNNNSITYNPYESGAREVYIENNRIRVAYANNKSYILDMTALNKGTTTDRPTLTTGNAGFQYYDSTINKPLWWNGTEWVDATGATV